ncbi:MAG: YdcF family protein [Elainellaceae cyanobacterium]
MFLFLSKILPLLVYPLGLSCVLIVVALVTLWKRPRIASVSLVLSLSLLLVFSNGTVSRLLGKSLEWQNIPQWDNLPSADAIVVLGGATRPATPPRPWLDMQEEGDRPLHGARLYLQGKAPVLIMSGGRISWGGEGDSEAHDMAEIALAMGVPEEAIIEEPDSLNTRENAVYVEKILEQEGIEKILLVTSALHMPRSLRIFKKLGIEAIAAPTDFLVTEGLGYVPGNVQGEILNALPEAERLQNSTRVLKEYLGMLIYALRGWV